MVIPSFIKYENTVAYEGIPPEKSGPRNWFAFGTCEDFNIQLNICPRNSGFDTTFGKDVGFASDHIQRYEIADGTYKSDKNFDSLILDNIPEINIKEYQPDLPEDQWIDIFTAAYNAFSKLFDDNTLYDTARYLGNSIKHGTLIKNLCKAIKYNGIDQNNSDRMLYDFPKILYRKLMSYQVTNYYTLPYSGQIFMESDGSAGWQSKSLSDNPIAKYLRSVNITTRPLWKLDNAKGSSFQCEVTLFNDTAEHAYNNFMFVHSIIPNNMWTQYGIFQHQPSLYDVQFQGGLRYFCCSLNVRCDNIGNNRLPPDEIRLLIEDTYGNNKSCDIRIPDVYKVTLKFDSLLPNNFNQYMMTFNESDAIYQNATDLGEEYGRLSSVYTTSMKPLADAIQKTIDEERRCNDQ